MPRFKTTFVIAISNVLLLMAAAAQSAPAQTFTVIHNFTGGQDGDDPMAGVTIDEAGNLYGTAEGGGTAGCGYGCGTVYQLKHKGSGWVFNLLYSFTGGSDGGNPWARVIFGPDGTLYGTTALRRYGNGTVFNLKPGPTACNTALCPWTVTVLHQFAGPPGDGSDPYSADLFFDPSGNIYGTTEQGGSGKCGGAASCGTVYELTPSGSGWRESVFYNFYDESTGTNPAGGVTMDKAGNLYGTTVLSYNGVFGGYGTVFQLTPSRKEKLLHSFRGGHDGTNPFAGVIFDQSGNLYGATQHVGDGGAGTVFELSPNPDGSWTYSVLYSFAGGSGGCSIGVSNNLAVDGDGNLYGTTWCTGLYSRGTVFKLTKTGGSWTYTSLHDFTGGSDGAFASGSVLLHPNGKLYGTAAGGGSQGLGVVWEITP